MAEYNLKVTAERIASTDHTTVSGRKIPAKHSEAGSYAVELPTGETIIMADSDFEASSTAFLA